MLVYKFTTIIRKEKNTANFYRINLFIAGCQEYIFFNNEKMMICNDFI
ncbi:hypothetical protein SRABI04_02865 [Chryseobacterium sp. Bi04]|nr:hypothetical protein SRABI04_02865 [Chryseobacterium sp. Bi04]